MNLEYYGWLQAKFYGNSEWLHLFSSAKSEKMVKDKSYASQRQFEFQCIFTTVIL